MRKQNFSSNLGRHMLLCSVHGEQSPLHQVQYQTRCRPPFHLSSSYQPATLRLSFWLISANSRWARQLLLLAQWLGYFPAAPRQCTMAIRPAHLRSSICTTIEAHDGTRNWSGFTTFRSSLYQYFVTFLMLSEWMFDLWVLRMSVAMELVFDSVLFDKQYYAINCLWILSLSRRYNALKSKDQITLV